MLVDGELEGERLGLLVVGERLGLLVDGEFEGERLG